MLLCDSVSNEGATYNRRANGLEIMLPSSDQYFDQAQVWFGNPVTNRDIQDLCQLNSNPLPDRGTIHSWRRPMKFHPQYRHRLQFKQLRMPALEHLMQLVGDGPVMINGLELASDSAYANINCRDDDAERLHLGWIRKWYRRSHKVRLVGDDGEEEINEGNVTRYDAPKGATVKTALYQPPLCRNTGELNCLHLEWKVSSVGPCRALGIVTPRRPCQLRS